MKRATFLGRVTAVVAGLWLALSTGLTGQTISTSGQWQGKSLEEFVAGLQQIASHEGASTAPLLRAAYTEWLGTRDREALDRVLQDADADLLVTLADLAETMQSRGGGGEVANLVDAVRTEGAERLAALEKNPDADYTQMEKMYDVGWRKLSPEERKASVHRLLELDDEVEDWSVTELRSMFSRSKHATLLKDFAPDLATQWLDVAEASPPSDMSQWTLFELWSMCRYTYVLGIAAEDFSVHWTGYVEAPTTGKYRFSICPINTNYEVPTRHSRQTMKVWVKRQQVLDSTQDGWRSEGEQISLDAGRKTPIRVEYTRSRRYKSYAFEWPAVAILFWEGPGCTKAIVPSRAFSVSQADRSGTGLQAEYQLAIDVSQRKETVKRVEPAIDHIWTQELFQFHDLEWPSSVVLKYPKMSCAIADELWSRVNRELPQSSPGDLLYSPGVLLQLTRLLTRRQKAEIAAQLLTLPSLLATYESAPDRLFWLLYPAAPDETLELLGTWAQLHPDAVTRFASHPLRIHREYKSLMSALFWGRRSDLDALEQRYLEMPDGTCCLPVAQIASYGHAVDGSLDEWIARLDERLADKSLQGDRRVNWLLARAKVEELRYGVRQGGEDQDWLLAERNLAGRRWIETACLTASSEPVRLRAYQELVVRLAADEQQVDAARQMIQRAARQCTSSASAAEMAMWRERIDAVTSVYRKRNERRNELADRAYVDRLRQRYQHAADAGDEAAMTRYEQMLSDAGVN